MPEISIIIPIYNVEKFLRKCLTSVINQTYKDIEIILVNDGSNDGSKEICEEFLKQDSRVVLINKENGGLSSARNAGIKVARGKYLGFVDSDDYINKEMYRIMHDAAINYNCDIVQIVEKAVDEDNDYEDLSNTEYIKPDIEILSSYNAIKNMYGGKNGHATIVAWSKLYKKELFNDIRFPEGKINEDEFVNYKLLIKAEKIININNKLYYYRLRNDSIMRSKYSIKRLDLLDAYDERLKFFEHNKEYRDIYLCTYKKYIDIIVSSYHDYKHSCKADKDVLLGIKKRMDFTKEKLIDKRELGYRYRIKIFLFKLFPDIKGLKKKILKC